jgi:CBS domain containing-hemolysin-like protein
MSDQYERTTVTSEPAQVVIRERSNSAGWWVAALVAVIALVGVVFYMSNSGTTPNELEAAREQGAAEANLATATQNAQSAATTAAQSAQNAAENAASATESAASAAAARTDQAIDDASKAAQDAVTAEPEHN